MSNELCKLLKKTPTDTLVKELMMNGEDISGVEKFVKYDEKRGLAYFINNSGSTFVAVCDRIDMIEFITEEEE